MTIKLLHNTPLWVASTAIRRCWDSHDKSDTMGKQCSDCYSYDIEEVDTWTLEGHCRNCKSSHIHMSSCGPKDKALIERVGNKNKHKSTLEHLVYTFDIDGISRACLMELSRHRIASYSVKSTRYVLSKELKDEEPFI